MNPRLLVLLGISLLALVYQSFDYAKTYPQVVKKPSAVLTAAVVPVEQRYPHIIERGSSLAAALYSLGADGKDIHDLVAASKPVRNLGLLQAGTRFHAAFTPQKQLSHVRIRLTAKEKLLIRRTDLGTWEAKEILEKVDKRIVTFKGQVESSLWDSAVVAGMHPSLISELAEIFAWQVDFAREVQVGDRWRLSVEQNFVHGEQIGFGSILSAEYTNGKDTHTAVLFRKDDKNVGYFAPDGSSLKRVFLKSPIQYGRISSRFQRRRLHPVLKIVRPHNGVDYAAPTGTPIRAVGDGVVWKKGYNSSAGNFVHIRHNSVYSTAYKHLSRFPSGLRKGSKVQQGQTIGFVGATGLASGPHLHFEFYVSGTFVDPLGMRFPAAAPISNDDLTMFTEDKNSLLAHLPAWENEDTATRQ